MIYPRLELLHQLLSEDGSIWITLDDSEAHYFKIITDEIFGRRNFVTTFIWRKVDSPNDNKVAITPDHDYVICYAKNIQQLEFKKKSDSSILDAYNEPDENLDIPYRDRLLKKNGKSSLRADRPSMYFPIKDPDGNDVYPIHDDGREARWAKGLITVEKLVEKEGLVWKKRKNKWIPYTRECAPEEPTRPWPTIWGDNYPAIGGRWRSAVYKRGKSNHLDVGRPLKRRLICLFWLRKRLSHPSIELRC